MNIAQYSIIKNSIQVNPQVSINLILSKREKSKHIKSKRKLSNASTYLVGTCRIGSILGRTMCRPCVKTSLCSKVSLSDRDPSIRHVNQLLCAYGFTVYLPDMSDSLFCVSKKKKFPRI